MNPVPDQEAAVMNDGAAAKIAEHTKKRGNGFPRFFLFCKDGAVNSREEGTDEKEPFIMQEHCL